MFRVNSNVFPLQPDTVPITGMSNAILATNGGEYAWSLSAAVTERKVVPEGVYVIVPTTFNPATLAMFEIDFYSGIDNIEIAPYQHSN